MEEDLFYRKIGEGRPLVILHGLYGCSDNWIPVAKKLAQNNEVILPDLPNHGQSFHTDDFSIDFMADAVYRLLKKLNLSKVNLAGHSLGGKVALYLTAKYPEIIEKLIVIDIAPRNYKPDEFDDRKLHTFILDTLLKIDLSKFKNRNEVIYQLPKIENFDRLKLIVLKNIKKGKEHLEWKINLKAIANGLNEILNNFDVNLKKITCPVMFIKAEKSPYINNNDIELIKQNLNAKIEIVHAASHWLHSEKPEELSLIIENFLR